MWQGCFSEAEATRANPRRAQMYPRLVLASRLVSEHLQDNLNPPANHTRQTGHLVSVCRDAAAPNGKGGFVTTSDFESVFRSAS